MFESTPYLCPVCGGPVVADREGYCCVACEIDLRVLAGAVVLRVDETCSGCDTPAPADPVEAVRAGWKSSGGAVPGAIYWWCAACSSGS